MVREAVSTRALVSGIQPYNDLKVGLDYNTNRLIILSGCCGCRLEAVNNHHSEKEITLRGLKGPMGPKVLWRCGRCYTKYRGYADDSLNIKDSRIASRWVAYWLSYPVESVIVEVDWE